LAATGCGCGESLRRAGSSVSPGNPRHCAIPDRARGRAHEYRLDAFSATASGTTSTSTGRIPAREPGGIGLGPVAVHHVQPRQHRGLARRDRRRPARYRRPDLDRPPDHLRMRAQARHPPHRLRRRRRPQGRQRVDHPGSRRQLLAWRAYTSAARHQAAPRTRRSWRCASTPGRRRPSSSSAQPQQWARCLGPFKPYLQRFPVDVRRSDRSPVLAPVPPARHITAWIMRPDDKLADDDCTGLRQARASCADLDTPTELAHGFNDLVRHRAGHRLQEWIKKAARGRFPEAAASPPTYSATSTPSATASPALELRPGRRQRQP
jgi:hypothetical protein